MSRVVQSVPRGGRGPEASVPVVPGPVVSVPEASGPVVSVPVIAASVIAASVGVVPTGTALRCEESVMIAAAVTPSSRGESCPDTREASLHAGEVRPVVGVAEARHSSGSPAGILVGAGDGLCLRIRNGVLSSRNLLRRLGTEEDGAVTAEYAITTMAAVAFAGLLVFIMRSAEVREMLLGLVRAALKIPG